MKKNLAVLVLLVAWSLLSIPSLSSVACAGGIPEYLDSNSGSSPHDLIVHVTGATDDGTGGDPGDAGDGYGVSDQPDLGGFMGGSDGMDDSILDEFLLILMSLIQLAL